MKNIHFADITDPDLAIVKEIYDYYIINSTSTYYTEPISIDGLREFIFVGHEKYKSFLIETGKEICGFCYISPYKKRQAYNRTAEISLYLRPEFTGKGIGKIALNFLGTVAVNNGISVLIGIISGDNENSIKLFEKCGYEKCAHFKKIGEKFNKILDVVCYEKVL